MRKPFGLGIAAVMSAGLRLWNLVFGGWSFGLRKVCSGENEARNLSGKPDGERGRAVAWKEPEPPNNYSQKLILLGWNFNFLTNLECIYIFDIVVIC